MRRLERSCRGGKGADATLELQIGERQLAGGLIGSAGGTTRASLSISGVEGNDDSRVMAISADGRYVAFFSDASNLVAGDTNGDQDSFIHDTLTGTTTRVSTDSSGNEANNDSTITAISANGRYVAFYSAATNLVEGDTNGVQDSFIKDTLTGITTRVSTDSTGMQGNGNSFIMAMSADGRYVAFDSTATNLVEADTNGVQDSFIKDTLTGITTRISTDSYGIQGNGSSSVFAISADGRYVAFNSTATNLVEGDTNGVQDSFIKDTLTGITSRISVDSNGNESNGASTARAISADGRYIAFFSDATNLVTGDTNGARDSFIKDTVTGATIRISTDSAGNQGNFSSTVTSISADGRFVAFHSHATNLVEGDTNGDGDAFVKDIITGATTRVSLANDGSQADNGISSSAYPVVISADGSRVAFSSYSDNLTSGILNNADHVFIRDLTKIGINEMSGMVVSNRISAEISFNFLEKLEKKLSEYEGIIGATQSRAQTFVNQLYAQKDVIIAAESRIVDADIAFETSELVRKQIQQRTATALLGQANQQPQLAINLLRNI